MCIPSFPPKLIKSVYGSGLNNRIRGRGLVLFPPRIKGLGSVMLVLVALHQSRGGGGDKDLSLNKIKFFDPKTLEINTIDNVMRNPTRDVVKEFNFSPHNFRDEEYVSMILKGYEGAQHHDKKHEILYYLARTHEAMLSPKIFAQTREKIAANEMELYIKDTVLRNMPMLRAPLVE